MTNPFGMQMTIYSYIFCMIDAKNQLECLVNVRNREITTKNELERVSMAYGLFSSEKWHFCGALIHPHLLCKSKQPLFHGNS